MHKKGAILELVGSFIFELVLLFLIIVAFFSYASDVKNSTRFERLFHARDIALLITTIESSPGNIDYSYETMGDRAAALFSGKVEMLDTNEVPGKSTIYYPFAVDREKYIIFKTNPLIAKKGKGTVQFSLQKNTEVTSQTSIPFVLEECSHVSTFNDKKNIILETPQSSLSLFSKTIELQNKLPEYSFNLIPLDQVSTQIGSSKGTLDFAFEKSTDDTIHVFAKANTKSQKLSCNLANTFRKKSFIFTTGIFDDDKDTDITLNAEGVIILAIPDKNQEEIGKVTLQAIADYFDKEPSEKEQTDKVK